MENIVYEIGDSIYINATNRCTNACSFCVRNYDEFIYGDLWLDKEPAVDEVLEALKKYDLSKYTTIVFCGYGEPTYRLDVIKAVSNFAHANGLKTRINTNGHGNMINSENAAKVLCEYVDTIGISLNEVDEDSYDKICNSEFGKKAFSIMLDFAKECVENGGHVVLSIVDIIGAKKIEKAKHIAKNIGAELRIRELI